jgi:hypothetical protein
MSLKKQKSQDKFVEVTMNSKEENSEDFCLGFVQEFSLWPLHIIGPVKSITISLEYQIL